ncbi:MAG: acyl-CoA dehydrogenase family protein, partial [Propionibacteriaceae bacterium]|nr:acyl-CoA dehydrogenase family protein [Propionibacteriaceae bacterium]
EEEMKLPDDVAEAVKSTGVVRMLQPKEFGGYESHPVEYMEAVYNIGVHDGSAGWVAGVVGVHPHELAQGDRKLQEELWGEDPDTWIASPYAPFGRARPVDGGWIFNGRWNFSSGTDHCQWVTIGGLITDQEGNVDDPEAIHFVLPRSDYEIVHDSWDVVGLRGTGSKDLIVKDAFVPTHRAIRTDPVTDGTAGLAAGRENALYAVPRNILFSACITTATLALAESTIAASIDWIRNREGRFGKAATDPYQLAALGAAMADMDASKRHVFTDMERAFERLEKGETISFDDRADIRRNQVRASQRAVAAADDVFKLSGGAQLQKSLPMQRCWRDAQAALHHIQNQQYPMYHAWGLNFFGHEPPRTVKI